MTMCCVRFVHCMMVENGHDITTVYISCYVCCDITYCAVQCREFYATIMKIVSSVQFLVTRSMVMQCEHLVRVIA